MVNLMKVKFAAILTAAAIGMQAASAGGVLTVYADTVAEAENAAVAENGAAVAESGAVAAENGAAVAESGATVAENGAAVAAETGAVPVENGAAAVQNNAASNEEPATGPALGAASVTQDETIPREVLEDGVLEYREIAARIENYNKDYRNTLTTLNSAYLNYDVAKGLHEDAKELMEEARELKDSDMDAETKALYDTYRDTAKELRKQASKLSNAELPSSGKRILRQAKNNLTRAVQNLMITREKTAANAELMDKLVELNGTSLAITQTMNGLGMKAEADVLKGIESSLSGENNRAQLQGGITTLTQNILNLLGWDSDAQIVIAPIGEPDLSVIAAMNLEEDTKSAIGANYSLYSVKSQKAKGSAARLNKKRTVDVSEQTITIGMKNLYDTVISKKQAYDADATKWQAAQMSFNSAQRMYNLGMLGKAEFLGMQVQYLQAKGAHLTAALDLYKAMEDYDWAKKGLMD